MGLGRHPIHLRGEHDAHSTPSHHPQGALHPAMRSYRLVCILLPCVMSLSPQNKSSSIKSTFLKIKNDFIRTVVNMDKRVASLAKCVDHSHAKTLPTWSRVCPVDDDCEG